MNTKFDHFHVFVVHSDWSSDEFSTLEEAREFIRQCISEGSDIRDFSIVGHMQFEV